MNKRLKLIAIFLLGTLNFQGCSTKQKTLDKLPNIIWLVAEDQSPEFFPMYGNKTLELPYLSSLANDGVVFTNAYTPVPVCAPARSALISGLYPTTLGTHNMRTYNAYNKDNQPSINIPSYSPLVTTGVKMFPEYLRSKGYYTTNNSKEDYNFKKTDGVWDESSSKAHWKNRLGDQPFFSVFNFGITHESQIWKQGDKPLLVDPEIVPVPPIFPNNKVIRKDIAVNYSNLIRLDSQLGEIIEQLKKEGLYEKSIIFFYADHGGPFPRYKRALYETGLKVPLIIKLPSYDKAGTRNNDFISFIDYAPTILSLVGIKPPDIMQGKAHLGKYEVEEKDSFIFASSDRFDEQVDRLRAIRFKNYKYIRNYNPKISNALPVSYREQMPMMQYLNQLWKTGELKPNNAAWFKTPKPKEELYDLEKDPYELNNLANKPILKDTLFFLREILNKWIVETNDLGEYSEKKLIKEWFPNGEAPKISPLKSKIANNKIYLDHEDEGVSIVWKKAKDTVWSIYNTPLDFSKNIQVKAVRIGYEDSPIKSFF